MTSSGPIMDDVTEIIIKSFHPLDVQLPDCDTLEGKVKFVLPAVHLKLYDLSLDGIIPGDPHIGGDAPMFCVSANFPSPVDIGKVMQFVVKSKDDLETLWKAYQAELDKRGALLG